MLLMQICQGKNRANTNPELVACSWADGSNKKRYSINSRQGKRRIFSIVIRPTLEIESAFYRLTNLLSQSAEHHMSVDDLW
jgi:hypothetical protein